VFDSSRRGDVRTVVNGFAGPGLRGASLEAGNESKPLRHSPDGVFVGVVAGYPEDIGLSVLLRFADGKTERHDFGHSGFVAPDPAGAMRIMGYSVSGFMDRGCVRMLSAREVKPFASGPAACGKTRSPYYFAVRRLLNGQHGGSAISQWHWNHASRTVVWGYAKKRSIRSVTLVGAGKPRRLPIALNGAFQALLPPSVDPARLQVVVRFRNGATKRGRLSANLVDPPGGHR
jgi:hypothetical protein